jgi:hypothetical protein
MFMTPGSKLKIGQSFPKGTTLLFWQASAPLGWTKITTQNDKLLRVVSGTGGPLGGGGSNAFSSVNAQTVVGSTTLSASQIPSITSSGTNTITVYPAANSGYYTPLSTGGWNVCPTPTSGGVSTPYTSGSMTYTNTFSASNNISVTSNNTGSGSHNHPINLSILYIDLILASKN